MHSTSVAISVRSFAHIAFAELNDPSVPSVSEKDKPLLAEALRRGESTREGLESVQRELEELASYLTLKKGG